MNKRKEVSHEDIAQLAYELYIQRGGQPGNETDDWLRAEEELNNQINRGSMRARAVSAGESS